MHSHSKPEINNDKWFHSIKNKTEFEEKKKTFSNVLPSQVDYFPNIMPLKRINFEKYYPTIE